MRFIKVIFVFSIFSVFLCLFPRNIHAVDDPLSVDNNRFGIHITNLSDLQDASKLVNSQGGDWGYVTLVIRKDQKDFKYWQDFFDKARRLHLIPILRIATRPMGNLWEKPNIDEIENWAIFLDSLNWPIKNRYVIIGNEPNHAKEWGGEISPKEYAIFSKEFSKKLKEKNIDFFVLPAGLDASAPNSKETMEESLFIRKMLEAEPDIFDYVDGLTSHSYPNPDFSGYENAFGKGTVRTYLWESEFLKSLGITKELPVFITETGWAHSTDSPENKRLTNPDFLARKYEFAFTNVWNDKKVVSVTPFILSYTEAPFDIFSWKDKKGNFYKFFAVIQNISKEKGQPIQETKGEILALFVKPVIKKTDKLKGFVLVKNTGQSIWTKDEVKLSSTDKTGAFAKIDYFDLEPGKIGIVVFEHRQSENAGVFFATMEFTKEGKAVSNNHSAPFMVLPSF